MSKATRTMASIPKNKAKDCYWSELDNIYNRCSTALLTSMVELKKINDSLGLSVQPEKRTEQNILINGFMKDSEAFVDTLLSIYKLHEGRKGLIKSDEDYMRSLEIGNMYEGFNMELNATLMPIFAEIAENIGDGVNKNGIISKDDVLKDINNGKDPDVIIYTEIIETTPITTDIKE